MNPPKAVRVFSCGTHARHPCKRDLCFKNPALRDGCVAHKKGGFSLNPAGVSQTEVSSMDHRHAVLFATERRQVDGNDSTEIQRTRAQRDSAAMASGTLSTGDRSLVRSIIHRRWSRYRSKRWLSASGSSTPSSRALAERARGAFAPRTGPTVVTSQRALSRCRARAPKVQRKTRGLRLRHPHPATLD